MRAILVVIALALASCAGPPVPGAGINMGDAVEPPDGFVELCARDPSKPECGGRDVAR